MTTNDKRGEVVHDETGEWRTTMSDGEIRADMMYAERTLVRLGVLINGAGIAACLGALGALASADGPPKIVVLPMSLFLLGLFAGLVFGFFNLNEIAREASRRGWLSANIQKGPEQIARLDRTTLLFATASFVFFGIGAITSLIILLTW